MRDRPCGTCGGAIAHGMRSYTNTNRPRVPPLVGARLTRDKRPVAATRIASPGPGSPIR